MARPRIVIAEPYAEQAVAKLRAAGDVVDLIGSGVQQLHAALAQADALLVRTYTQVTAELLELAPRLKVIGRGGVGLDNIDLAAAAARGVTVVYTPAASTRCVAEHTWALILAVERRLAESDAAVRAGQFFAARDSRLFRELGDLTLGIIGMGRIGSLVGQIGARGFGLRVLYHDVAKVGPFDFPTRAVSREKLYAESDIITLHLPLSPATRGSINAAALARCKPGAVLINTARGGLIDSGDIGRALQEGRLAGAAIDVFDAEPPPANHPLLSAPNVLLSPHVAGRSAAALARMNDVVDDVLNVLAGRPPRFPSLP